MGSELGSFLQVNCTCNLGYSGSNGGPCSACSVGAYKDSIGSGGCTSCPVGTSSNVAAAVSSLTCAVCSRGTFNQFVGQPVCQACLEGYFNGNLGSSACSSCVAGSYSGLGAVACTSCGAGSYSDVVAATSSTTCVTCSSGAWALAGSTLCQFCGACSYWSWPKVIVANTVWSFSTVASAGTNSKPGMTLTSSTTAIVSDNADLYSVSLATMQTTNLNFQPQETRYYSHVEASRDRASLYLVQSMVYRVSLPSLTLLSEYVVNGPGGASETLDGTGVWIGHMAGLSLFNVQSEAPISTFPLPSGISSVVISPCLHTSYPASVFVAGSTPFGFRSMNAVTGVWTTLVTSLGSLNKCEFTPDGNFAILTSISGAWIWSVAQGTTHQIATGQVNDVLVDPSQSWILLAKQTTGLHQAGLLIQDPATCSQGLYSAAAGLQSSAQCQTCPTGSLCPGGSNITQCVGGSYSFSTGLRQQGQCLGCPAGYFCPGGNVLSLCPVGAYSLTVDLEAASQCALCPAGYYCQNTTVIAACPSNTNSNPGSSLLSDCQCDAGYQCQITQVIHAQITLPLSVSSFSAMQAAYIAAVAAAAGVSPSQVVIVSVQAVTPSGRRLLGDEATHSQIMTSIYGSSNLHQPHRSLDGLSRQLEIKGLPSHSGIRIVLRNEVKSAVRRFSPK